MVWEDGEGDLASYPILMQFWAEGGPDAEGPSALWPRDTAVHSAKLDNGLTMWLVSEPGFPKVAFTAAVQGGFAADPADRPGISELLSKTVDQGTKARTAKQIAQELQAAGGDLSASSKKDFIEVSTAVLASKMDAGIAVLSDILQNATFPDAEVTLAKRNLSDSLRQSESEPSFLARRAMAKVLFGDHPYHTDPGFRRGGYFRRSP